MRFVYLCVRCQKVAGIARWPGEEAPYSARIDEAARECTCGPVVGHFGEQRDGECEESTLLRTPAPPFVR